MLESLLITVTAIPYLCGAVLLYDKVPCRWKDAYFIGAIWLAVFLFHGII